MPIEVTVAPDSFKSYHLRAPLSTPGKYTWSTDPGVPTNYGFGGKRLAITNDAQVLMAPFQAMRGGRARLGPLNVAPILLLFSQSPNPDLGNSVMVWLPSGCTFGFENLTEAVPFAQNINYLYPIRGGLGTPSQIDFNPAFRNGGFETAGAPIFSNWATTATGGSVISQSPIHYEGAFSCRFDMDGAASPVKISQNILTKGVRYRLSLTGASGAGNPSFYVDAGNGEKVFTQATGGTSWETFEYEFTAGSTTLTIGCRTNPGLSVLLDAVRLVELRDAGTGLGFKQGDEVHFELQNDMKYFSWFLNATTANSGAGEVVYGQGDGGLEGPYSQCFLTLKGGN